MNLKKIKDSEPRIYYTASVNLSSPKELETVLGSDPSEYSDYEVVSEYNYDNFDDAYQDGIDLCLDFAKEYPGCEYVLLITAWDDSQEIYSEESASYNCWIDESTGKLMIA